jgi:outer membrane protein assembly factor BamB
MRYCLTLAALLAVTAVAHAGDTWPQFRGPAGDGISDAKELPTHWSETENVRWKAPVHDKGWSSPVVWGDQVWVTTAREDGHEFYALGFDRATGKLLHDVKVFEEEHPAFCHPFNSYASPTPVIEAGRLYAHFGAYGTACLDTATGQVLWQRRDLPCNHFRGPGSSPVVYNGLVYLVFDGFDLQYVAALDKATGRPVWRKDRGIKYSTDNGDYKKAYATPAVVEVGGKPQLVCPSAEATIAYDPATGAEFWRVIHGGMNAANRPVTGHGLVYLTSGHNTKLLAVRLGGAGELPKDSIAWQTQRGVPNRPSLLLRGDLLFMVNDNGVASCLDAATGKVHWSERLGGGFSASPVFAAGHLYLADQDGKTHVLEAGPTFKEVTVNRLDAGCMASPAVAGDALFLRTKTHLYCIGRRG